jgi:hypothetical protein
MQAVRMWTDTKSLAAQRQLTCSTGTVCSKKMKADLARWATATATGNSLRHGPTAIAPDDQS